MLGWRRGSSYLGQSRYFTRHGHRVVLVTMTTILLTQHNLGVAAVAAIMSTEVSTVVIIKSNY